MKKKYHLIIVFILTVVTLSGAKDHFSINFEDEVVRGAIVTQNVGYIGVKDK